MYITSMTHRDELFDLTLRWLNDDFSPEDGKTVTRIFLYESAVSAVVIGLVIALLEKLFRGPLQVERVSQKQVLRERLIRYLPHRSLRTRQTIQNFRENPEYFFPHLPIDAALIITLDSRLAAIGVPLYGLVSSESEMQNDFTAAETIVIGRFRGRNVRIPREAMTVNDLLGFKIIGEPELIEQAPAALQAASVITLVEVEKHSGDYNAVNVLVDNAHFSATRSTAAF